MAVTSTEQERYCPWLAMMGSVAVQLDEDLIALKVSEDILTQERFEPEDTPIPRRTVDLDALDACPHLLGGGLVEQNVTLATGSGRLVPQIKKSQLGLDTACGMWYTVYITPDGGRA